MRLLNLIFSGGFGYFQAAAIGILTIWGVWIWKDYKDAKKDVETLTQQVETLKGTVASKDTVIASMGRSAGRRDAQSEQSKDLADEILKATDGTECSRSEPVIAVLRGLRLNTREASPNATDKAVSVPARTYSTDNK